MPAGSSQASSQGEWSPGNFAGIYGSRTHPAALRALVGRKDEMGGGAEDGGVHDCSPPGKSVPVSLVANTSRTTPAIINISKGDK